MGVAERRAREKEVLRQAILEAAGEIVVADGHTSLSIRKIADKIEYAPSTIYLYFQDKYAILAAISVGHFEELTDKLAVMNQAAGNPVEALRTGMRSYVDFGLAHPNQYQITFLTQPPPDCPPDHPATQAISKAGLDCFEQLMIAVHKAMDAGLIRRADVNETSQNVWLSLHGLTAGLIVCGKDPAFPWVEHKRLIDSQITMILRGIGSAI
jgi:AcrR family transcriptional regulator